MLFWEQEVSDQGSARESRFPRGSAGPGFGSQVRTEPRGAPLLPQPHPLLTS